MLGRIDAGGLPILGDWLHVKPWWIHHDSGGRARPLIRPVFEGVSLLARLLARPTAFAAFQRPETRAEERGLPESDPHGPNSRNRWTAISLPFCPSALLPFRPGLD